MWHFITRTNISTILTIAQPSIASNVATVSEINEGVTQSTSSVDKASGKRRQHDIHAERERL